MFTLQTRIWFQSRSANNPHWSNNLNKVVRFAYYDYSNLFLVAVIISTPLAFRVSAVGWNYNKGAVGKNPLQCGASCTTQLVLSKFPTNASPWHSAALSLATNIHLVSSRLCLFFFSFFLANHIVWGVIIAGNTETESPPESPLWTPIALHDSLSLWGSLEQDTCWNKWPFYYFIFLKNGHFFMPVLTVHLTETVWKVSTGLLCDLMPI